MAGRTLSRLAFGGLAAIWVCQPALSSAQSADAGAAYIERGHQTEARQHAYHDRMDRLHDAIANELRRAAPDLLPKLEPAPPKTFGYGILPRILPDPAPTPPATPEVVRFSWAWSDTLIARENAALDTLERDFESIRRAGRSEHAAYERLVADYKTRVDRRRPIDADVDYNWHWQKQIADNRALFDRLQARLDAEVSTLSRSDAGANRSQPMIGFDPSPFVRIEHPVVHEHVVIVPLFTDITDPTVIDGFVHAVETYWQARDGDDRYRVQLAVTMISSADLYCGRNPAGCAAPAAGEKIDLAAHAKRFPENAAALTTGAASLQIAVARALVLGPHDVTPRTLAHEFGHLLGFPDQYLRGYRDLGAEGFQVLELVANQTDIMSSISTGSVTAAHFEGLMAATDVQIEMAAGLTALYEQNDPVAAIAHFRAVLARNPDHFGGTFQLAKALDRAGRRDEALVVWRAMLELAESAHNIETATAARERINARH